MQEHHQIGHGHSRGHSHGHAHPHGERFGGWEGWESNPVLGFLIGALCIAAVATLIGLAAFAPSGEGREEVLEEAETIGLGGERITAEVESVTDDVCPFSTPDNPADCRTIVVIPEEGPNAGELVALPEFIKNQGFPVPSIEVGDQIIVDYQPITEFYSYSDFDRRGTLVILAILFAAVVVGLGRVQGLLALVAMAITVVVLIGFVAAAVLDGSDPILVCLVAASFIAFVTLYLTHGFNPTTTVALMGTLLALALTVVIAWVFFGLAKFTGLTSEAGLVLPIIVGDINLSGLLLGGAMISALGALDDVTVTQVATVDELYRQNPKMSQRQLLVSGIRVGREHIGATVNTLLLAYAGVSLPLVLLFVASDQPLGLVANSEVVAVEIVRTLCGSFGLIAAVPITTWLAAVLVTGTKQHLADESDKSNAPEPQSATTPPAHPPVTESAKSTADPEDVAVKAEPPTTPVVEPKWDDFKPREDKNPF